MRGRVEAAHAERWTITELLDIREVLLAEWHRRGVSPRHGPVLLMLGDVYRDLVALCGKKEAALAMAQRDQEDRNCHDHTS